MDRHNREADPIYVIREAYVHGDETEVNDEADLVYLTELYYGYSENEPGVQKHFKLGFEKFWQIVSAGREQRRINISQARWFYNRQTLSQIFFRFGSQGRAKRPREAEQGDDAQPQRKLPRSVPLMRNDEPFYEIQVDVLHYARGHRMGDSQNPIRKKPEYILVSIDPATRFGFVRPVENLTAHHLGNQLARAVPPEIQRRVQVIRADSGPEFKVAEFTAGLRAGGWNAHEELVQKRINKAGTLLKGSDTSPSTMAPVESLVRTVRELIEYFKRGGHRGNYGKLSLFSAQTKHVTFQGLINVYNKTKHGAFKNKFSPEEIIMPENRAEFERFIAENNERRGDGIQAGEQNRLRDGEYVRVLRAAANAGLKQSLPSLSYDVYEVHHRQRENDPLIRDNVRIRLRRLNQRGRPPFAAKHARGAEIVVHHTRIARIKTLENGETMDPPDWSSWNTFIGELRDNRYIANRQLLEKAADYDVDG